MVTIDTYGAVKDIEDGWVQFKDTHPIQSLAVKDWIIPANGRHKDAWHHLRITLADDRPDCDTDIGRYTSQISAHGMARQEGAFYPPPEYLSVSEYSELSVSERLEQNLGLFDITTSAFDPPWLAERQQCWACLDCEYNPALTKHCYPGSTAELTTAQRNSSRETAEDDIHVSVSEIASPDPVDFSDTLSRAFPDIGLEIEYDGVVRGSGHVLELPRPIACGFDCGDALLLKLYHRGSRSADASVDVPAHQNLLAVNPDASVKWVTEYDDPDGRAADELWVEDGVPMIERGRKWYEIDPSTGEEIASFEQYYR